MLRREGLDFLGGCDLPLLAVPAWMLAPRRVDGLFACGQGVGFAGGIVSAAIEGQRVADAIATELGIGLAA